MRMARSQASMGNAFSLLFALFYNMVYVPTEFASLQSLSNSSTSSSNIPHANSSATSNILSPAMVSNAIQFYYGRIISRIFLMFFMSFCIGSFVCSRICIPEALFQSYFQDYMFKELRGLRHRDASSQMHLMRRLVSTNTMPSSVTKSRNVSSSDELFIFGVKINKSVLLPYIANFSNPIFFLVAYIPCNIMRLLFPKKLPRPQPFTALQHACFQMIVYNDSMRRSAKVPAFFMDIFSLCISRLIPRRLLLMFCDQDAKGLLEDMDTTLYKFPVDQRIHLFHSVICHSNCCTMVTGLVCMMMFVQNAFASDMVVASWFSIPHSQKRISNNDPNYPLFHNYRELINWEYIINSHFIFFLFFNVNLTCTNAIMFMVLAPSFIVTAAGFYSNQGASIDLTRIDFWFIVSLVMSYFICYITNALTYNNIFKMFVNRTSDLAIVSDSTMVELSHEFMSLSRITLDAMSSRCTTASALAAGRIRCMMWLLRKQQFEVQKFRPDLTKSRNEGVTTDVSIRRLLRQEFEHGNSSVSMEMSNFGAWFAALCSICNCRIEFNYEFGENQDVTVRCVEYDIRHFFCSFLFSVLLHAFYWSSSATGSLKVLIRVGVRSTLALNTTLNRRPRVCHNVSANPSVVTPYPSHSHANPHSNHVYSVPGSETNSHYAHVSTELLDHHTSHVALSHDHAPWIAPFLELDNFAIFEFITRMHGSVHIPRKDGPECDPSLGAFSLPCSVTAAAATPSPNAKHPLRFLIIEDKPKFAAYTIARIKVFPPASDYTFDHEANVADALAKFSSGWQSGDGRIPSSDSNAPYDIVLIDMFMPMERGGAVDSQAGVGLC